MNECSIVICNKTPTWEGSLSTWDGKHTYPVGYCDEHAQSQRASAFRYSKLTLTLTPVKAVCQRSLGCCYGIVCVNERRCKWA